MLKINIHSMWTKCFLLIFFFIVLPITFLSYYSIQYNMDTIIEQKRLTDLQNLSILDTSVSEFADQIESVGLHLANDPQVHALLENLSNTQDATTILDTYTRHFPKILHISFLNSDCAFVQEQSLDTGRLSWFFNPGTLKRIKQEHSLWTASYNIEFKESGYVERVISYIHPVYQQDKIKGYVILHIPTKNFKTFLTNFSDNALILENNYFFASSDDLPYYENFTQYYLINTAFFFSDTSTTVKTSEGPQIITTQNYRRLNLQFVILSSYNDFKKDITVSSPSIILTAVVSIFFALFVSILLARQITQPVTKLKRTMVEVQRGDFSIRANVRGKDEVADLSHHFNLLLEEINELILSLNQRHKEHERIQLQLIQEQVKPHFLYNMLETINSLVRSDLKKETIKAVSNFAAFYRISLNGGNSIVPVKEEYELIKNYLELQQLRYIEFMDYTLAITPKIMKYHIPKLTLQPLIENAIYHGIKAKGTFCTLCVSGYMENNQIVFEIFDTGNGMTKEQIHKILSDIQKNRYIDSHFGISSVIRRLNLFTKQNTILNIDSVPTEYTCIQIKFPAIVLLTKEDLDI